MDPLAPRIHFVTLVLVPNRKKSFRKVRTCYGFPCTFCSLLGPKLCHIVCLPQSFLPYQRACSLIEIRSRKPPLTLPVFALDLWSLLATNTVTINFKVRITVFKLRPKTLSCSVSPSVYDIMTTTLLETPTIDDSWLEDSPSLSSLKVN